MQTCSSCTEEGELGPHHPGRRFQNQGLFTGKTSQREIRHQANPPTTSAYKPHGKCIMVSESAALGEKQQMNTSLKFSLTFLVKLWKTVLYEKYLEVKNISTAVRKFNLKSIVRN